MTLLAFDPFIGIGGLGGYYIPTQAGERPELQYSISNVEKDAELLMAHKQGKLDVIVGARGEMQLKVMSTCDRALHFLAWLFSFFGANDERKMRFSEYVAEAGKKYKDHFQSAPEKAINFYRELRKWDYVNPNHLDKAISKKYKIYRPQFDQAVKDSKKAFREIENNLDHPEYTKRKMHWKECVWKRRVLETEFGIDCKGLSLVDAGGGANGAQFGLSWNGNKRLTVVKEKAAEVWRLRSEVWIPTQRPQPWVCDHDPREAEVVAYMASEFFGFDIVPTTGVNDQGHSIQLFSPNGVEAERTNPKIAQRQNLEHSEVEILQLMAIFNYLTGDLDGKDDNWKVVFDLNDRVIDVVKFDNGNSFPAKSLHSVKDAITLRKTYAWKKHKWAEKPLNPSENSRLKRVLKRLAVLDNQIDFLVAVIHKFPGFWTRKRINLFRDRIHYILAANDLHLPLKHLGEVYSKTRLKASLQGRLLEPKADYYERHPQLAPRAIQHVADQHVVAGLAQGPVAPDHLVADGAHIRVPVAPATIAVEEKPSFVMGIVAGTFGMLRSRVNRAVDALGGGVTSFIDQHVLGY